MRNDERRAPNHQVLERVLMSFSLSESSALVASLIMIGVHDGAGDGVRAGRRSFAVAHKSEAWAAAR